MLFCSRLPVICQQQLFHYMCIQKALSMQWLATQSAYRESVQDAAWQLATKCYVALTLCNVSQDSQDFNPWHPILTRLLEPLHLSVGQFSQSFSFYIYCTRSHIFTILWQLFCLFCLFCCFTSQVNSYGHCGTVSSSNHTFFLGKLEQADNQ